MSNSSQQQRFKVVLLGEGRVGKTSIVLRYAKGEYNDRQDSTLQANYLDKAIVVDGTSTQLLIWDTAGQEKYHALGPIYYRDSDGALLVYDITDSESFLKVKKWVKELRTVVGDEIIIAIAGNKVDLIKNRTVDEAEAIAYAESMGASHFYTSAKTNRGLDDVFYDLSQRMTSRRIEKGSKRDSIGSQGKPKLILVDETPETIESKSSCC